MLHALLRCSVERVRLYGLSTSFIFDSVVQFTSCLPNSLKNGHFTQIFYDVLSIDWRLGRVINRSLGDLLQCLAGDRVYIQHFDQ